MKLVDNSIDLDELRVKAVVDVRQGIMVVDAELHSDEEGELLAHGSRQHDLWGINLHPDLPESDWVEFDSMVNLRPSHGNRSRGATTLKQWPVSSQW